GTTKPPYTLALAAALFRNRGYEVRAADLTGSRQSVDLLADRLDREGFTPTLVVFPSTTPTLDADARAMAELGRRYGAPLICYGPHASTMPAESMARAADVDGMLVGEPEDALLQIAALESVAEFDRVPSL